jgi:hypothetical protein
MFGRVELWLARDNASHGTVGPDFDIDCDSCGEEFERN